MNCPLDRTDALGSLAASVGSGNPAAPKRAGRVGSVGDDVYRLVRTTPTA
ncbi:hypothetical protein NGM10_15640 (plasmid) [Halorussus salilacus]|nr:hypothetical protein [Halorussus salilacus]USZ69837.1 hypothetical protein NGM10_15640 [Halorussus salilacus]